MGHVARERVADKGHDAGETEGRRRPLDVDAIGDLKVDLAAVGGVARHAELKENTGLDHRLLDHEPPTAYEHLLTVDEAVPLDADITEPRKGIHAEASAVKSGLAWRGDAHEVDAASGRQHEAAG